MLLIRPPIIRPQERGKELPSYIRMTSIESFGTFFYINLGKLINKLSN